MHYYLSRLYTDYEDFEEGSNAPAVNKYCRQWNSFGLFSPELGYAFVGCIEDRDPKAVFDADPDNRHVLTTDETHAEINDSQEKGIYGLQLTTLAKLQAEFDSRNINVDLTTPLTGQEIQDIITAYYS